MADVTLEGSAAGVSGVAGYLHQSVAPTSPAPSATGLAPGGPVAFEFLATGAGNRIEDFEGGVFPSWFLNCSPTNGFTATGWNDGTDQLDIYDDGGNKVLRAQGRATALATGSERAFLPLGNVDVVVRVRWYTGATAGLFVRGRFDSYGKTTDMRGAFAEIDSGGLRLGYYSSGSRTVDATSTFSPVSGTWYWLRLQISGPWGYSIRCKYWTGTRASEPSSWNLTNTGGIDKRFERWNGNGIHVLAGTAYFDDFEVVGEIDPAAAALLTAEFNGEEYAVGNPSRTLVIEPYAIREEWFAATGEVPFPDITRWRCSLGAGAVFDHDQGTQTVEVLYDGESLQTWTFETASIPEDPFAETGGGDPDRIGLFRMGADNAEAIGRRFTYLVVAFLDSTGGDEFAYAVAPLTWRTTSEDFRYTIYSTFGFLVNGEYWIAHPITINVPSEVIPGQPVPIDIPAEIIPEGSLDNLFVASLIPQGYKRSDTPAAVIASVRFTYRGRASGVVSIEFLKRFAGSGLVFDTIRDNVADIQVIDESTYQALVDAGATWS